jgi:hypothetical protein
VSVKCRCTVAAFVAAPCPSRLQVGARRSLAPRRAAYTPPCVRAQSGTRAGIGGCSRVAATAARAARVSRRSVAAAAAPSPCAPHRSCEGVTSAGGACGCGAIHALMPCLSVTGDVSAASCTQQHNMCASWGGLKLPFYAESHIQHGCWLPRPKPRLPQVFIGGGWPARWLTATPHWQASGMLNMAAPSCGGCSWMQLLASTSQPVSAAGPSPKCLPWCLVFCDSACEYGATKLRQPRCVITPGGLQAAGLLASLVLTRCSSSRIPLLGFAMASGYVHGSSYKLVQATMTCNMPMD